VADPATRLIFRTSALYSGGRGLDLGPQPDMPTTAFGVILSHFRKVPDLCIK
jgi:hypothetical protein